MVFSTRSREMTPIFITIRQLSVKTKDRKHSVNTLFFQMEIMERLYASVVLNVI